MNNQQSKKDLLGKDFILLIIGQIISLFGNAILRFALPLYILKESGSAALFGIVSASAFLPMVLVSPIGGILADRIHKQRIMVVLDFFTAACILVFMLALGKITLIPLVIVFLMLLYGIQGAYSPAVQASLPILVDAEHLMAANAIVSLVQSLSGLLGPVAGGILFGVYGLMPLLIVSCGCFAFSAVLELFIRIPHTPQKGGGSIWGIVKSDLSESFHFLRKDKPVMLNVLLIVFAFNLFMSSMLMIGLPVLITQVLGMSSQMYGISQGVMAAGGIIGGVLAGALGGKLPVSRIYVLLILCASATLPMGLVLLLGAPAFAAYLVFTAMSCLLMVGSTLFSVRMLAFVQMETPQNLIGKVISCIMALALCAQPIGQALYGFLFEQLIEIPWLVVLAAAVISCGIAFYSRKIFGELGKK